MHKEAKEFTIMWLFVMGNAFLWGSLFIAFMEWTYSMGYFRATVMGLALVGASKYLKMKWEINE